MTLSGAEPPEPIKQIVADFEASWSKDSVDAIAALLERVKPELRNDLLFCLIDSDLLQREAKRIDVTASIYAKCGDFATELTGSDLIDSQSRPSSIRFRSSFCNAYIPFDGPLPPG